MQHEGTGPDAGLVAFCGLYCGQCGSYKKGRCPGCSENKKAGWCKIRACCQERGYANCGACAEFAEPNDCGRFNNIMSRVIGFVLNSDRRSCVLKIREIGTAEFAVWMHTQKKQTLPRRT